jgi:hypothetical protein
MTIFALTSGRASELIRIKPKRGLGPKQIAWCRRKLAGFKQAEQVAARVKREAEQAKEKINATQ